MLVELHRMATPEDLGEGWCCACGQTFERSVVEAHLYTEDRVTLGELCPACLSRGPEHIERRIAEQAQWARMEADEMERAASETVDECPTLEEYQMLVRVTREPKHRSVEEAN